MDQLYLWKTLILVGLWTVADGCVRKSVGKRCLKCNQTLSGFQFGGGKHVVRPSGHNKSNIKRPTFAFLPLAVDQTWLDCGGKVVSN